MSKVKYPKVEKEKLLVVEGDDENRVITTILRSKNIDNIQVIPFGGKNILAQYLKNVLTKDANFNSVTSIGIIRDADNNPKGAFDSVCSALKNSGLAVPHREIEKTESKPTISVLILPGNGKNGSLEDLFIDSIRDKPVLQCVENYFGCVKERQGNIPNQIGKAKVHTFLASVVDDPDKRLGESTEAGIWDLNHSAFELLHQIIKIL